MPDATTYTVVSDACIFPKINSIALRVAAREEDAINALVVPVLVKHLSSKHFLAGGPGLKRNSVSTRLLGKS